MSDRDPVSWAERWQTALAAWGLVGATAGGLVYRGVRWWRRIRRAARGGDSERPPAVEPRHQTPPGGHVEGEGMIAAVGILAERLRASERTCEAL